MHFLKIKNNSELGIIIKGNKEYVHYFIINEEYQRVMGKRSRQEFLSFKKAAKFAKKIKFPIKLLIKKYYLLEFT